MGEMAMREKPSHQGVSHLILSLPLDDEKLLQALLYDKNLGERLLELLAHGWGHLDIIISEHAILKVHMTKTDA